jgi:hypothetical protein
MAVCQILTSPSVHLANDPFAAQTGRSLSPAVWRQSKTRKYYYHKLQFYFPNSLASCTEFANRCSTLQRMRGIGWECEGPIWTRYGGIRSTGYRSTSSRYPADASTRYLHKTCQIKPACLGRHLISLIPIDHQISKYGHLTLK